MEPPGHRPSNSRRRWAGGLALATSLAMLIAGETILKGRLSPLPWLLYWIACLLLTTVAIVAALLDLRAVARRTTDEQRHLIETTVKDIVKDVREKPPGAPPTPPA